LKYVLFDNYTDKDIYELKINENILRIEEMIKTDLNDYKNKSTLEEIVNNPPINLRLKLENIKLNCLQPLKYNLQSFIKESIEMELQKLENCSNSEELKCIIYIIDKSFKYLDEDENKIILREKFEYLRLIYNDKMKADF